MTAEPQRDITVDLERQTISCGNRTGCYELVPIPDPKLGPRKKDVAIMYNTERYRPIYANKHGMPIFLNRAS